MRGAAAAPTSRPAHARIAAVGLALLAALALLLGGAPRWAVSLQAAWFDACQWVRPRAVAAMPATVVEIDERSLARLGQWPWPRTTLAELIRAIGRHDPAAIGIDILMPEPDRLSPERLLPSAREADSVLAQRLAALPANDAELARAVAAHRVVLGLAGTPERTATEPPAPPVVIVDRARDRQAAAIPGALVGFAGALGNLPILAQAAAGHGAISGAPGDDVIRRIPLVMRIGERIVPALSIEMLRVALDAPALRVHARGAGVEAIGVGDFVVPVEADGQLRPYYARRDARRRVSAIDVLDGRVDPLRLARKLVLVGATGLALVDYQSTPLRERMPGSEIQAQLLENLYEQSWLTRPAWAPALEVALFVLLGLALIAATPRWQPGRTALLAAAAVLVPMLAAFGAFLAWRLLLDWAAPALGLVLLYCALLVMTLADAARQRRALEQAIQRQREQAAFVAGELAAAQRVQLGFLPRADAIDDPRVEIAATMVPAREVGGDLYDFFLLDERRLFVLIGDVAGKGLSASLFMAVGKALYKSITLRSPQAGVGRLMRDANIEVARDNPDMFFVTAIAGTLDLHTGVLTHCNAGHEDPYLVPAGGARVERLAGADGPPLSAVAGFAYGQAERALQPGDLLCLVTDGVVDAQDALGRRYGSERVAVALARLPGGSSARQCLDALRADIAAFASGAEPADDLSVLVVRWLGPRTREAAVSAR